MASEFSVACISAVVHTSHFAHSTAIGCSCDATDEALVLELGRDRESDVEIVEEAHGSESEFGMVVERKGGTNARRALYESIVSPYCVTVSAP